MPARPQWLHRLTAIIEELEYLSAPVIDRGMTEQLFGVRRRQALDVMRRFGARQSGNALLLERERLIDELRQLSRDPQVSFEQDRRKRLGQELETMRREQRARAVQIPVGPGVFDMRMRDLSADVSLGGGRLLIRFHGTEDLLRKLFELSQAATNDYDRFCAAAESSESVVSSSGANRTSAGAG